MNALLKVLVDNYNNEEFPELVYEIEQKMLQGSLSIEWRKAYDKYCSINPAGTDGFSYYELGDVFLEEVGGSDIFKEITNYCCVCNEKVNTSFHYGRNGQQYYCEECMETLRA